MSEEEKKAIDFLNGGFDYEIDNEAWEIVKNLIEKHQKEIEELKILKDDISDKRIVYIDTPEFEERYIPKQKIKDKIEELQKEIEYKAQNGIDFSLIIDIVGIIEVLKELLEEE